MNKAVTRLGDHIPTVTAVCTNRTGATLLKGQFAMMDILKTQAETTSVEVGNAASVFANLTPVTQAGYDAGFPIYCCDEDDGIPDNQKGQFVVEGVVDAAILDDDVSTTDIDIGDHVRILVSESAVAAQAPTALTQRTIGIACEDAAASSSNTDRMINATSHRRRIIFDGKIRLQSQSA